MKTSLAQFTASAAFALYAANAAPVYAQDELDIINTPNDTLAASVLQDEQDMHTRSSVYFEPAYPFNTPLGMGLGGAGGALALAFGLYALRRKEKLAAATLGTGALVALSLTLQTEQQSYTNDPTEILVVIDQTSSNTANDRDDISAQIEQHIRDNMEGMDNFIIRPVYIDAALSGDAEEQSRLFDTLRDRVDITPEKMGGVIFVTDGQVHNAPDTSPYGDIPVYTILTGPESDYDRAIEITDVSPFGLVDKDHQINFTINEFGDPALSGNAIEVLVTQGTNVLQTLQVVPGEPTSIEVPITTPGVNSYTIKAQHLSAEVTDLNNSIAVEVEGLRENLNIFMMSGSSNNSARDLSTFYKADPASQFIHFMPLRLPSDLTSRISKDDLALGPVPYTEIFDNALDKFNIFGFDQYENNFILPYRDLRNIVDYANEGGSVMVIAGEEFSGRKSLARTPIGNILPVEPTGEYRDTRYTAELSEDGKRHPLVRDLPGANPRGETPNWGPWISASISDVISDTSRTLLETPDGQPLLVIDELGENEGRVAILLSGGSFALWDGPDAQLLQNVSHWLMHRPDLEAEALRANRSGYGSIIIERQTLDAMAPDPAIITGPDGITAEAEFTQEVLPGLWQAEYRYLQPGLYHITQDNTAPAANTEEFAIDISVGLDFSTELAEVIATPDIMQPIADSSGGTIIRAVQENGEIWMPDFRSIKPETAERFGEDWMGLIQKDIETIRGQEEKPFIPPWLTLLLGTAMIAAGGWSRENSHRKLKAMNPFAKKSAANENAGAPNQEPS